MKTMKKKTDQPQLRAPKNKPGPFDHLLATLAALYEEETHRLADELRPRILAGEFSDKGDGSGPFYLVLADHLTKTHPWLSTQRGRLTVQAGSRWGGRKKLAAVDPEGNVLSDGPVDEAGDDAGEWMAHDILSVAAARGWVKPMRYLNDANNYALRVA